MPLERESNSTHSIIEKTLVSHLQTRSRIICTWKPLTNPLSIPCPTKLLNLVQSLKTLKQILAQLPFFFNLSFFLFILLYNTVLVLPYINMSPSWVYTCSQSWTPLPTPSPYHLSGSSQCTSPKHPISCIEPRLAIRFLYNIIHVSMPFSQIIPPSPFPTESKRLFYTSVSLLLSRIQGIFGFVCNVLSRVWFFVASWTIAHQPPLPTEFSRQQYWSRCHFLLQSYSWPRIEPGSPESLAFLALVKFYT